MRADEDKHVRFGTRVNSRVPLVIRWVEDGRPATVEARTLDISASGCFVVAAQPILIGQRVRLTNLVNGNECAAQIVRHGQQTASSWELGIKLEKPSDEFWGLEF
jgi:PilZ domain